MKKSALYTKTGDKGQTSLVSGTRISKSDSRINLYGEVDELNSYIGLLISEIEEYESFSVISELLTRTQINLFNLGSRLACESSSWEKFKLPSIEEELISKIEEHIDQLDSSLPKLKTFILPGGSKASSHFHVARTVCRRTERSLVEFNSLGEQIPQHSLNLLNRLSDYLFVSARYVNLEFKKNESLWKPNE